MVKAYRDTWQLGIHSYLSYLRDRLVVAKELLGDPGSIFVQIGLENVHRLRLLMDEIEEARVWLDGLDRVNNCTAKPGISICLVLSATPFYLKGSGHPEGSPFPWIVSDFGLVDAIESGIVKIPRLPVMDTTGRPDPKYFKLWKAINENRSEEHTSELQSPCNLVC